MRFQPKTLLAAVLLVLAASPALAMVMVMVVMVIIMAGLLPARSRARILAISCWRADITWFAIGASETPRNSLANSRNYWRA